MSHYSRVSLPKRFARILGTRAMLAFIAIAGSVFTPNLLSFGQPPRGPIRQGRAPARIAQRPQQGAPKQGAPKPQEQKLTDVGRSGPTTEQTKPAPNPQQPLTVATEEERNQKIAVDWKDPWAVIFLTGNQSGYIEPCGCTGLENQKGGLNRRDTLLTSLRNRNWNVIPVDAGNQVRRHGQQSAIKFRWTATALREMGYEAVAFGEDDLQLSFDDTLAAMLDDSGANNLFVSANVKTIKDFDLPYKVVAVGDRKIGITSILIEDNNKISNGFVTVESAVDALKKVSKSLVNEKVDYQILLIHASLQDTQNLVKSVPQFDLVVTSGGYGEPTYRPEILPGIKSQIVQVGAKGMYAGIVGLFNDTKQPIRYQRIALSSQFEDSPRMLDLFGRYQDELKASAENNFQSLGLRPQRHPSSREFVGSEKCGSCHTTAFEIWKKTPHAHATDSLIEPPQRSIARHFDPECLACHVTGWNPQVVYAYRTGYESLEATPHMIGNGCENCHGPGSQHVAAEDGEIDTTAELIEKLRAEMRLPMDKAEDKCLECHDGDNSPEFHKQGAFNSYWEQVKHVGKD